MTNNTSLLCEFRSILANLDSFRKKISSTERLFAAAENGNLEQIEELLKHDKDVNAKDKNKKTALYYAEKRRNWKMVQWLLEHGAEK